MKQHLLSLCAIALCASASYAQGIYGYDPVFSNGTYTPLTDATIIYDASAVEDNFKDQGIRKIAITPDGITDKQCKTKGYEIGFNYPLAGVNMSEFVVSGAGWVAFGNDGVNVNPQAQDAFFNNSANMSAAGAAPQRVSSTTENTKISYKSSGEGENALLVVQFENYATSSWYFPDNYSIIDFQLIFAADGAFSIVYRNLDDALEVDTNLYFRIGISHDGYYTFLDGYSAGDWEKKHLNTGTLWIPTDTTPDGFTISFSAPTDCITPVTPPSNLILSPTSTSISGSFTPADTADSYLVVYSSEEISWAPQDGTNYAGGDSFENVNILLFDKKTQFEIEDLSGGSTIYVAVFAASSYGFNGPKYNFTPLKGYVKTLPEAPAAVVMKSGDKQILLDISANGNNDEVVVVLTEYCLRDMYGDHGIVGPLSADAKVGDVLEVPEDWAPIFPGMPIAAPTDGGTVVYVGNAANDIVIDNLKNSTLYYASIFSRDEDGRYSYDVVYREAFTVIEAPFDGCSDNYRRWAAPGNWQTAEESSSTQPFNTGMCYMVGSDYPSQGTQIFQPQLQTKGNTDGFSSWLITSPIFVNGRHLIAKFDYCITISETRYSNEPYNNWHTYDELNILVSEDNGESWTLLTEYYADNHAFQESLYSYVSIEADLDDYQNKSVLLKLEWKTRSYANFNLRFYIDRFSLLEGETLEVPEVSVNNITHNSANVSWKAEYKSFEVAYRTLDEDSFYSEYVEDANSYTITDLDVLTSYEVKVRGIIDEEQNYSDWSEPVSFTTLDWPAVDAPEGLTSDISNYQADQSVKLSWSNTEDMTSYEVAYRESSSTEWSYVNADKPEVTISDLKSQTKYIWKVRAFCTHDRETEYSAQATFDTPSLDASILLMTSDDSQAELYSLCGVKVDFKSAVPGIYILKKNGQTYKVKI